MNEPQALPITAIPTAFGTPLEGGFYAGRFRIDGKLYANVVAGAEAELTGTWNQSEAAVPGALSYADGLANTQAMAAAGSDIAAQVLELRLGGHADWHIPARDQLELLYRYLKPTEHMESWVRSGDNPSSVPPGYPYTDTSPAQTASEAFREGTPHALASEWYWASTQNAGSDGCAWCQHFGDGGQDDFRKSDSYRVRPVRSILIIE